VTDFIFETINWSPFLGASSPDLPRLVRAAARAGFRLISFDTAVIGAWRANGATLGALRRLVEDEGLSIPAVHSIAVGARHVHVGGTAPLGPALLEATNAAAVVCRQADAVLAVEFLPFLPIASIADARAMIVSAETRGSGLVVDSWHFFHGPDDWPELERLRAEEISYVQFDDHPPLASSDLLAETTARRVYPGRGVFDLERFARTLTATGFTGPVGLEHLSAADRERPVEEVARELLEASRGYWPS
jgi:sugar phosphate isomerase/epimerase